MSADAQTGETVAADPTAVPVQVALCRAALDAGAIPKDDVNPQQGFKFRGMEKILTALGPAMSKHGVVPMPKVIGVEREQMERGGKGAMWRLVTLTVEYRFVGPAGDCLTATVLGEGLDNADKALPKAMTMAYKAALLQVFKIGDGASDPDALTPPEQSYVPPMPPEPESPYITPANVARASARAEEMGLTQDEIREAVDEATEGRTVHLDWVAKTEVAALRDAFAHIVQSKQPDPCLPDPVTWAQTQGHPGWEQTQGLNGQTDEPADDPGRPFTEGES